MKKKTLFLIIILVLLIGLFPYFAFGDNFFKKEKFNYFDFILPSLKSEKEYLFYYENNIYYTKYDIDKSYLVFSVEGTDIDEDIKKQASMAIEENKPSFKYNKKKYEVIPLKKALYDFKIDITWAMKKMDITSEKINHKYGNIEIEKNNVNNEFKLYSYDESSRSSIFIKDIEIKQVEIDGLLYNNITEIDNYNNDMFIEQIDKIGDIKEVFASGGNILSTKIYTINNVDICVVTKFEDKAINYYISLYNKNN